MLLSNHPETYYQSPIVHEVVCQLRFPAILRINEEQPAKFQDMIRNEFPKYGMKKETVVQRTVNQQTNQVTEEKRFVNNHNFLNENGTWKINITQDFVALSTLKYSGWKEFAGKLDRILAAFIETYQPSYFSRVGLRFVNVASKKRLNLQECDWDDLFTPAYLGLLNEGDVFEKNVMNASADFVLKLDETSQVKVHAGPGILKNNNPKAVQDTEVKFILDQDLFSASKCEVSETVEELQRLHGYSIRIFEGAITDVLRDAMGAL